MKKFAQICLAVFCLAEIGVNQSVSALRCYSCSITSQNSDTKCLNDPISVEGQGIVECNKKYCTILRQELKDPPGRINTFARGCEERPTILNDIYDDPIFKTFYRSCTTDLCNDGDGVRAPNQRPFSPDGFDGENLLVPGLPINSAYNSRYVNFFYLVTLINIPLLL